MTCDEASLRHAKSSDMAVRTYIAGPVSLCALEHPIGILVFRSHHDLACYPLLDLSRSQDNKVYTF